MDLQELMTDSLAFGGLLATAERAGVNLEQITLAYRLRGLAAAYEMFGYLATVKQMEDNAADLRQREGL